MLKLFGAGTISCLGYLLHLHVFDPTATDILVEREGGNKQYQPKLDCVANKSSSLFIFTCGGGAWELAYVREVAGGPICMVPFEGLAGFAVAARSGQLAPPAVTLVMCKLRLRGGDVAALRGFAEALRRPVNAIVHLSDELGEWWTFYDPGGACQQIGVCSSTTKVLRQYSHLSHPRPWITWTDLHVIVAYWWPMFQPIRDALGYVARARNVVSQPMTTVIPLPYMNGFTGAQSSCEYAKSSLRIKTRDRMFSAFLSASSSGFSRFRRHERAEALESIRRSTELQPTITERMSGENYSGAMRSTIFALAPRGNFNMQTFRVSEAILGGAIPVVSDSAHDVFEAYGQFKPLLDNILIASSWQNAVDQMLTGIRNYSALDARREALVNWWCGTMRDLQTSLRDPFNV